MFKQKLEEAMKIAMKARDSARLSTIRMALSALKKKEIDTNKELSVDEEQKVLQTMLKQLGETEAQSVTANRPELAAAARAEIAVLKTFLPQELSAQELQSIVKKAVEELRASPAGLPAGGAGLGAVMKAVMAASGGRAEGRAVQVAVKEALGLS